MPLQIRPADLVLDRAAIVDLCQRYLAPGSSERRFQWLYQESPHGRARAWLAFDTGTASVVGMAAAFARHISFDGNLKSGWILGDFCIDERFRSLGPALQLQRACLEATSADPSSFCYDFPSQSMMSIYKRLGASPSGSLVRWAKPLRAVARIEKLVGRKMLARAVGIPLEALLARRGWKGDKNSANLELHVGQCGTEFDVLNHHVRAQSGIFTDRTHDYLNWRYLANPTTRYEILAARRAGSLVGYGVFSVHNGEGRVVDLCAIEGPGVIAWLLAGIVEQIRSRQAATVSMNAGDSHPWASIFERAGFRRREEAPVVAYPRENFFPASGRPRAWYLMQGERDS